jgi:hypothetical protein
MELGGIDTEDRLPSAAEAALLCEDMKSFCSDFDEIEKRLAIKGVSVASRIAKLPPSADYASIINISGYEIEKEVRKISASNKKRVREAKTMRRGDGEKM